MQILLNTLKDNKSASVLISVDDIVAFHRSLPGYRPTPLVSLESTARKLGIGRFLVKDEGQRFGLKAFKVLGASYAVFRMLRRRCGGNLAPETFLGEEGCRLARDMVFTCATDGNHGRAVAWMARLLGTTAVIFMPRGSVTARIRAIESEGARVVIVTGGYDEAVRCAAVEGRKENHFVIADTSYPGYTEIPRYIQEGYMTMFRECENQLKERGEQKPALVLLQAGVGAFASAAAMFYPLSARGSRLVSVEPYAANCLFHSIEIGDGNPHSTGSTEQTIMAGLNCETPSGSAWPLVRDRFDAFISIEDHYAEEAMRELAGEGVVAGESGAAGLAALIALKKEYPGFLNDVLGVGNEDCVMIINTEADTDPEAYRKIVGKKAEAVSCPA